MKQMNEYAKSFPGYVTTPKAVAAAIAWALALRLSEDNEKEAHKLIRSEWKTLNENGIVPQKP